MKAKRKRPGCCQHWDHAKAVVLGVGFCVCRGCGHRWQEFPLNMGKR